MSHPLSSLNSFQSDTLLFEMVELNRFEPSWVDTRSNREGSHVLNFMFLQVLVEVAINGCRVEVVGRNGVSSWKEQVLI